MSLRVGMGYDVHRVKAGRPADSGRREVSRATGAWTGTPTPTCCCTPSATRYWARLASVTWVNTFRPSDARWKDASSLVTCWTHIAALLRERNASIANVDAMLIAEAPEARATSCRPCARISHARSASKQAQVSVKATTNETLGAIGRREGLAAMAVALVERD